VTVRTRVVLAATATFTLFAAAAAVYIRFAPAPARTLADGWESVVTTIAGGGVPGFAEENPYSVHFKDLFGVAAAADGTIYVADGVGAHRIYRITPEGRLSLFAGSERGFADGPGTSARFDTPSGLAIGGDGSLYVADTGNNAIRRISRDGYVSTVADARAGLNGPVGVAIDGRGQVLVADTYNDRIARIEPGGTTTTIAGTGSPGADDGAMARFDTPCGIAVDALGNIYVADSGNGSVRLISTDGSVSTVTPYGESSGVPLAVAVSNDSLFVADARGRILELTAHGGVRIVAGSGRGFADGVGSAALFRAPSGIALRGPGRLIVSDRRNGLVRAVDAQSQVELRPPPPPLNPQFDAEAFGRLPVLWPFTPLEGPFEVTGTLGEPRGAEGSERFHAGLDVYAPEGTPVHVVRDAVSDDPLAASDFGSLVESVRIGAVAYIHLRVGRTARDAAIDDERFVFTRDESGAVTEVRLKRGSRFAAGEAIGTVNRFYHAHLNVGWPGEELNPLQFALPGFADSVAPVIARGGIRIVGEDGELFTRRRKRIVVHGRIRVLVDAWDQVDGNLPRRRLGLYRLGYQILDASGVPISGFDAPYETIRFDRRPLDEAAARIIYAAGSGIPVYGNRTTRFLYVVTSTLHHGVAVDGAFDTGTLTPGDYTLRILAADASGNEALRNRDLPITVKAPGQPVSIIRPSTR
jgi:sugar lactone lactonase YvrE